MSYLQININNIPNPKLKEILAILDKSMKSFGVEFYLIGARARDFWLAAKNIPPRRFTEDIDFAILMNSIEDFEKLKDYLENTGYFIKSKSFPQRIYTTDREFMIDLLPFVQIAKAYYVTFKDKDKTRMSTLGLKEVFEKSLPVAIDDKLEILTASLPGIIILKLIAWNDRPDSRSKDLKDIAFIIKNYFDLQDDLIYEKHNRYFGGDIEIDQIAALALGSEMKEILSISEVLRNVVKEILNTNAVLKDASPMIQIMQIEMELEADKITEYINLILQGINGDSPD